MSIAIKNEDDFQAHVMKNHKSIFEYPEGDLYPKVDMIRGRKISPEIDVLSINPVSNTIAGYEFKFLNKRKDTNYAAMRGGMAQAIEYFQYGIDKSYLVLGIPTPERVSVDKWGDGVTDLQTLFRALVWAYGFDSLGLKLWYEDRDLVQSCEEPRRNFPIERLTSSQFDGYRLDRACLFSASFHWDLGFIRKYGLGPIGFWSKTFPKHKSSALSKRQKKVGGF
jgi:hypothetical protein